MCFCIYIAAFSLALGASTHPPCGVLVAKRSGKWFLVLHEKVSLDISVQRNLLHGCPFPPRGSWVWRSIWLQSNPGRQKPSFQPNPLSEKSHKCFCQQGGDRSVMRRTEGRVGFPILEAASCQGGSPAIITAPHPMALIVCPLPAAAVLAQEAAALNFLVLPPQIWQLIVWLLLTKGASKLMFSWGSNGTLLLKGEGLASPLCSCFVMYPLPSASSDTFWSHPWALVC